MKIRRVISLLLMCAIVSQSLFSVSAAEIDSTDSDIVVVHDREKNDRINDLFALRSELELDFETNYELIAQIDQQLIQYGVVDVCADEIMSKLGGVVPAIDIPSTNTVKWTSRRIVVTYNGQLFELQIYEGIAANENSPLLTDTLQAEYEAAGVDAAVVSALKIVASEALGAAVDKFSENPKLTAGMTLLNVLLLSDDITDEFKTALSTSTVLNNVHTATFASVSTKMQYIFVKPYETPDYGNQLLSYVGSSATYCITSTTRVWNFGETVVTPAHMTTYVEGETYSPYYNDYSVPARIHYNYRYNGVTNFNNQFYLESITFKFYDTELTHPLPMADIF